MHVSDASDKPLRAVDVIIQPYPRPTSSIGERGRQFSKRPKRSSFGNAGRE